MARKETGFTCPRCGGRDTVVRCGKRGDMFEAYGECNSCGWEDMHMVGDDPDLLFGVAKRSFPVRYDDGEVDGLPTADELAGEVSTLAHIICSMAPRCEACPLHETDSPSYSANGEGYYFLGDTPRLGGGCQFQSFDKCRTELVRRYSRLPA